MSEKIIIKEKSSEKIKINESVRNVYPPLENLNIRAKGEKQVFKHKNSYGYDEVTVEAIDIKLQEKEVTPNYETQIVMADNEYDGLGKVTVNPQTGYNTDDATAVESDILAGKIAYGVNGKIVGSMTQQNNALINNNSSNVTAGLEELTIDVSDKTSLNGFFSNCSSLTKLNMTGADTGKITNMWHTFYDCKALEELPIINMEKVTSVDSCFYNCYKIKKIPFLNTSKATMLYYTFYNCKAIEELPEMDGSLFDKVRQSFYGMTALTIFGGIKNLGKNYTMSANYSYCTLNLSSSAKLTKESLLNVINGLYDLASAEKNTQSLILGDTNLAKLTAEEIEIATNKGWTVS